MGVMIEWLSTFILLVTILGIIGYQLMCLTDLEFDYINPYDSATRINKSFFPEFIGQGVLCFLFLITGHWFMFLLSIPYLYYNVRLYMRREHLVDVTEIYNQLEWEKKKRLAKLLFTVLLIVFSIFWLIWNFGEDYD